MISLPFRPLKCFYFIFIFDQVILLKNVSELANQIEKYNMFPTNSRVPEDDESSNRTKTSSWLVGLALQVVRPTPRTEGVRTELPELQADPHKSNKGFTWVH